MDVPGRRVLEDDTLQEHILAVDQRNHHWTQKALIVVPFCLGTGLDNVHVGIFLGIGISLRGYPVVVAYLDTPWTCQHFLPLTSGHLAFLDRTPALTITIDDTTTSNGNVLTAIGREWRLTTAGFQTFKRGLDDGVELVVTREQNDGTYLQVEIDVRLQLNRSCKPYTSRNQQSTTALIAQLFDGLGKSIGVQGDAIAYSTKVLQIHLTVRELRGADLGHGKWEILRVALVGIFAVSTCLALVASVLLC